jgi:hypothetical protein
MELCAVRSGEVFQVGDVRVDLSEHVLWSLGPAAPHPRHPGVVCPSLLCQDIPVVGLLLKRTFLHQLLKEGIDRAGRRPPPTLAHFLHGVHQFDSVFRRFIQEGEDPHPEATPMAEHSERPHIDLPIYRYSDIIDKPFSLALVCRHLYSIPTISKLMTGPFARIPSLLGSSTRKRQNLSGSWLWLIPPDGKNRP